MARKTNNSNRKFRKLSFQGLEARTMMAGDVYAKEISGDLHIYGDDLANEVSVTQAVYQGMPVAGKYWVTGLNGTTINGHSGGEYVDGVTHDFRIGLGEGNDRLTLGTNTVPHDLLIDMGQGGGTDAVTLNRVTVHNTTKIDTGGGLDTLNIRGTFGVSGVANDSPDMWINTGAGNDSVTMHNTFVRRDLRINTGTGDNGVDKVDLTAMNVGRDLGIRTGGGTDTVTIDQVGVNRDLGIITDAGVDTVSIKRTQVDKLTVHLGAGNDFLKIENTDGRVGTLTGGEDSGGGDFDIYQQLNGVTFTESLTPSEFER